MGLSPLFFSRFHTICRWVYLNTVASDNLHTGMFHVQPSNQQLKVASPNDSGSELTQWPISLG